MESHFYPANLSLMMASGSTNPRTVLQLNPGGQPIYQEPTLIQGNQSATDTTTLLTSGNLQGVSQTSDQGQTNAEALQVLAQLGRVMREKVNSGLSALQLQQIQSQIGGTPNPAANWLSTSPAKLNETTNVSSLLSESLGVGAMLPIGLRSNTGLMDADSSNYLSTISTPFVQASVPHSVVAPGPTVTNTILELLTGQLGPLTTQQSVSHTNEAQGRVGQAAEVVDYLHGQVSSGIPMSSVPTSRDQYTIPSLLPVSSTTSVSNLPQQQQQQQFLSNAVPGSRGQHTISSLLPVSSTTSVSHLPQQQQQQFVSNAIPGSRGQHSISSLLPVSSTTSFSNLPQQQQFLSNAVPASRDQHTFSSLLPVSSTTSVSNFPQQQQQQFPANAFPPVMNNSNLMGNANMMMGQRNVGVSNQNRKRQLESDNLNASPDTFHHGKHRKATVEFQGDNACKLYVGGIYGLTKDDLGTFFSQYGTINNIEIPKKPNGDLQKFGFIHFQSRHQVMAAFQSGQPVAKKQLLRHYYIKQKYVEVGLRETKQAQAKEINPNRFFLGGVKGLTQIDVCKYFSQFGNVVDCSVMIHNKFGFLEFDRLSHNQQMNLLRNHTINNVVVSVQRTKSLAKANNEPVSSERMSSKPKNEPVSSERMTSKDLDSNKYRFFVGNTSGLNEEDLLRYFSRFGPIVDCTLKTKKGEHKKDPLYGFVEYKYIDQETIKQLIGPHTIIGIRVIVHRATSVKTKERTQNIVSPSLSVEKAAAKINQQINQQMKGATLYVRGLEAFSREDLMEYFSQYGPINAIDIPAKGKDGKAINYGFIHFRSRSQMEAAFQDGQPIEQDGDKTRHYFKQSYVDVGHTNKEKPERNTTQAKSTLSGENIQKPDDASTLFVGRLNTNQFSKEEFMSYFSQFGEIVHINILESKHYGFIKYRHPSQAEAAYRAGVSGHGIQPRHFIGNSFVNVGLRK